MTRPFFTLGYIKYRKLCSNIDITKFEDLLINMHPDVSVQWKKYSFEFTNIIEGSTVQFSYLSFF
jgi:hypothetical protein